ncbi:MAG: antibiotic biosynthesis monooxygenase [Alphaproteobacteria bacterium]|jgi:heme-degrading monooxygenase HmoA|nr:antibiotic biosynthesis monooxygenase [Alphaproteobacteria bacterium]MBT7942204.1 antibiotic biosynthesis monooxygenase [Alphaproteobacteria bacterium]
MPLARLPDPPYYAVIFASRRTDQDEAGYNEAATAMSASAAQQDGYLGMDTTARDEDGMAMTVSYWREEQSIQNWKQQADHTVVRKLGREKWYRSYTLRVAKVERAYEFDVAGGE